MVCLRTCLSHEETANPIESEMKYIPKGVRRNLVVALNSGLFGETGLDEQVRWVTEDLQATNVVKDVAPSLMRLEWSLEKIGLHDLAKIVEGWLYTLGAKDPNTFREEV
jgi:hypothetical protein